MPCPRDPSREVREGGPAYFSGTVRPGPSQAGRALDGEDGPWNAESWCHHALATVSLRRLQVAGVVHAGVAVHARRTVEGEAREGDEDLLEESGSVLTTTAAAITSSSSSLSPPTKYSSTCSSRARSKCACHRWPLPGHARARPPLSRVRSVTDFNLRPCCGGSTPARACTEHVRTARGAGRGPPGVP